jgi:tetratricopeptide (TPR) repeat protein
LAAVTVGFTAAGDEPGSNTTLGRVRVYKSGDVETPKNTTAGTSTVSKSSTTGTSATGIAKDQPSAANPKESGPAQLEATSFKGVSPGNSTQEDVARLWGPPKQTAQADGALVQLYTVGPFQRVEVNYAGRKVSSIVIRLDRSFPIEVVAKQLNLTTVRPVTVVNELGEIIGESYPERGIAVTFELVAKPNKLSMKVSQIVLEPLSAEPFVLRAENTMEDRIDLSARDLKQALELEPDNAKALWLLSRVLSNVGQYDKAAKAAGEAVRIEPNDPQYRIARARTLAQTGQWREAMTEAKKAAAASDDRPHLKAQATCLVGDLMASGPIPDFRKAMTFHTQAIQLSSPLVADPHPAIRIAAKEVLIDAHVGVAFDVAWGEYKDKARAVPQWLNRATAVATDLVDNEGRGPEQLFRVFSRALTAYVGVREGISPTPAVDAVGELGEKLLAKARGPVMRAHIQSEIGTALYDAVQVYQMRSENEQALKCGEIAAKYLAESLAAKPDAATSLLLGRLYFRIGDIHASQTKDYKTAAQWYDKAVPLLDRATAEDVAGELSRHGYAFARMGGAYWNIGQREKAVALTQKGVRWMEQAVKQGEMERSALALHYSNLAAMHRNLGARDAADRYQELADRAKTEKLK